MFKLSATHPVASLSLFDPSRTPSCLKRFFDFKASVTDMLIRLRPPKFANSSGSNSVVEGLYASFPIVRELVETSNGDDATHAAAMSLSPPQAVQLVDAFTWVASQMPHVDQTTFDGIHALSSDLFAKVGDGIPHTYNSLAKYCENIASYLVLLLSHDTSKSVQAMAIFPAKVDFQCVQGSGVRLLEGLSYLNPTFVYDVFKGVCERLIAKHELTNKVHYGVQIHLVPGLLRLFGVPKHVIREIDSNYDTIGYDFPPKLVATMLEEFHSEVAQAVKESLAGIGNALLALYSASPSKRHTTYESIDVYIQLLGGDRKVSSFFDQVSWEDGFESLSAYVYSLVEDAGVVVADADQGGDSSYEEFAKLYELVATNPKEGQAFLSRCLDGSSHQREVAMQLLQLLGRNCVGDQRFIFLKYLQLLGFINPSKGGIVPQKHYRYVVIDESFEDTPLCRVLMQDVVQRGNTLFTGDHTNDMLLDLVYARGDVVLQRYSDRLQDLFVVMIDSGVPFSYINRFFPGGQGLEGHLVLLPRMGALAGHPDLPDILGSFSDNLILTHDSTCVGRGGTYTCSASLLRCALLMGFDGDLMEQILQRFEGSDYREPDMFGWAPLMLAAHLGRGDVINRVYHMAWCTEFFEELSPRPSGSNRIIMGSFVKQLLNASLVKVPEVFQANPELYTLEFFAGTYSKCFSGSALCDSIEKGGITFLKYLASLVATPQDRYDMKAICHFLLTDIYFHLSPAAKAAVVEFMRDYSDFTLIFDDDFSLKAYRDARLNNGYFTFLRRVLSADSAHRDDLFDGGMVRLLAEKGCFQKSGMGSRNRLSDLIADSFNVLTYILRAGDLATLRVLQDNKLLQPCAGKVKVGLVLELETLKFLAENGFKGSDFGLVYGKVDPMVFRTIVFRAVRDAVASGDGDGLVMAMRFVSLESVQLVNVLSAANAESAHENIDFRAALFDRDCEPILKTFKSLGLTWALFERMMENLMESRSVLGACASPVRRATCSATYLRAFFRVFDVNMVSYLDSLPFKLPFDVMAMMIDAQPDVFEVVAEQFDGFEGSKRHPRCGSFTPQYLIRAVSELDSEEDRILRVARLMRLGYSLEDLELDGEYLETVIVGLIRDGNFELLCQVQRWVRLDLDFYASYLPVLIAKANRPLLRALVMDRQVFLSPLRDSGQHLLDYCTKTLDDEDGCRDVLDVAQVIRMVRFYLDDLKGDLPSLLEAMPHFFERLSDADFSKLIAILITYRSKLDPNTKAGAKRVYESQGKSSVGTLKMLLAMGYTLHDFGGNTFYTVAPFLLRKDFNVLSCIDFTKMSTEELRLIVIFTLYIGSQEDLEALGLFFDYDPYMTTEEEQKAISIVLKTLCYPFTELAYFSKRRDEQVNFSKFSSIGGSKAMATMILHAQPDLDGRSSDDIVNEYTIRYKDPQFRMNRLKTCFGEPYMESLFPPDVEVVQPDPLAGT